MVRGVGFFALALALTFVLPTVDAHIVPFQQAVPLALGPYNALVQPKPDPMYANTGLSMTAIFSRAADGTYAPALPATLELMGPEGYHKSTRMEPDGTGYVLASLLVPVSGNYTAKIIVNDSGESYANQTQFFAYPDLPIRIQTEDPNQPDPSTNDSTFQIGIATVDNITLQRSDKLSDMTLVLEHWSDDHKTLYGSTSMPMKHASKGLWRVAYAFPTQGMFHLRFSSASGGLKPDDVPILHVYARDPAGGKKSPGPGIALGLAVLAGAGLARRRRR